MRVQVGAGKEEDATRRDVYRPHFGNVPFAKISRHGLCAEFSICVALDVKRRETSAQTSNLVYPPWPLARAPRRFQKTSSTSDLPFLATTMGLIPRKMDLAQISAS